MDMFVAGGVVESNGLGGSRGELVTHIVGGLLRAGGGRVGSFGSTAHAGITYPTLCRCRQVVRAVMVRMWFCRWRRGGQR